MVSHFVNLGDFFLELYLQAFWCLVFDSGYN